MHVVWISFTNEKELPDTALKWKKESPYETLLVYDDLIQSLSTKSYNTQYGSVKCTIGKELHKMYYKKI